jgi:hypothetical protein
MSSMYAHPSDLEGLLDALPARADGLVHPHELPERDGAVPRRRLVSAAGELCGGGDKAVVGGHDERRHRGARHRRASHRAVLDALQQPVRGDLHASSSFSINTAHAERDIVDRRVVDLELVAKVDDEGAGHGLDADPVAAVRHLEAGDAALEQQRDEVAVAVRRQAQRARRVRARRVVVDVHDHVAGAEVPLEVVRAEAHALAQQPQQLQVQAPRRRDEPLRRLPEAVGLVGPGVPGVGGDGEAAGQAEAVPPVALAAGAVGGAGEEAVGLACVLRVEGHLVLRGEAEELLAARLHVPHHLLRHAVVHHLHACYISDVMRGDDPRVHVLTCVEEEDEGRARARRSHGGTWKKPSSLPASRTARRTSSRGPDRSMTGSATAAADAGGRCSAGKMKLSGSVSWDAPDSRFCIAAARRG